MIGRTDNTIILVAGKRRKLWPRQPIFTPAVQNQPPKFADIYAPFTASDAEVLDRCSCDGNCNRQHTGPCPNVMGVLAAGSRNSVRMTLVNGRLFCMGCLQPRDPNKRWSCGFHPDHVKPAYVSDEQKKAWAGVTWLALSAVLREGVLHVY